MPRRSRVVALGAAALAALLAAPGAASASFDLTHGQRFGDRPNEIVDVSHDGRFLVATQGKGIVKYDLSNLGRPVQTALLPTLDGAEGKVVLGNGTAEELELDRLDAAESFGVPQVNSEPGPTSVALVRDRWVIAPYNATNDNVDVDGDEEGDPEDLVRDPVDGIVILDASDLTPVRVILFNENVPAAGGIDGAPGGTAGVDPLLEVPDSVAVSPDGTRAVIAVENDRELGQPITPDFASPGGTPGFIRGDVTSDDPDNWSFDLIRLPQSLIDARGENAQPEFVDVNDDNQVVGSIQEANAIAVFDLDDQPTASTLTDAQIHDVGSSTFLADLQENDPISLDFDTEITRERQPDTVQWIAGGTLVAMANEGENGEIGGSRDFSIHNPDGTVVSKLGSAFEQATADYGFLADDRNEEDKGSEPEGMDAVSVDGRDYLLVLGERAEALSTWDVTFPQSPRLISFVPTGPAPEGIKANAERGFAVVANEELAESQGDAAFMTMHRFTDSSLLPTDRLIPRGNGNPYFDVRGLGAGSSADDLAMTDATVPTRVLNAEVGGHGYAPLTTSATVAGAGEGRVLEDVAPAPGGGSWVVSRDNDFELARLDAAGAVVSVEDLPGEDLDASGVAVTPDGGTVYVSVLGGDTIFRYDAAADTFASIALTDIGDAVLDLALAGDGDLLAVVADDNKPVSDATIVRYDDPANTDNTIGAADTKVLATVPLSASRSSTDITGLALAPGGELWAVSGSRDGGDHLGTADLRRLVELPAPINTARPAVTGTPVVGQQLTCGGDTWRGGAAASREWRRDGVAIAGATAATYAVTAGDVGQPITCAVIAAGADAFQVAVSNRVVPVQAGQRGDQGDAGQQGPQGPGGQQGPTGPNGPAGPTGPGGQNGPAGPTGQNGPAGATGPGGPVGPGGPSGPAGSKGDKGDRGARGATPRISVSCRLAGRRIRCTVRNARASAAVVAKRGHRVVRRAHAGRKGTLTFSVPRSHGRLTVAVGGKTVRT